MMARPVSGADTRRGIWLFLTACCKDAKSSFPEPLAVPYRLEGTTLANRLAPSRDYKHFCISVTLMASRRRQDKRGRHRSAAIPSNELSRDKCWANCGKLQQHIETCRKLLQNVSTHAHLKTIYCKL